MIMFSPESLEAQKLISVSIGKINASRINRTGTSLHKSLLVASVLHKARNVYLDEERERASRYPQCPTSELTVTPVCPMNINTNDLISDERNEKENRLSCSREDEVSLPERVGEESRLPLGEANTGNNVTHTTTTTTTVTSLTNTTTITTTSSSQSGGRKRRRISDQETAAAISSILPKRLRSELKGESLKYSKISHQYNNSLESSKCSEVFLELKPVSISPEATSRLSPPTKETESHDDDNEELKYTTLRSSSEIATLSSSEDLSISSELDDSSAQEEESPPPEETSTSSEDSDDSDSDDSSGSSSSDSSTCEEMEVDKLTSLVSYFGGFAQPQQNQSDYRIVPLHSQSGQHVVALTA